MNGRKTTGYVISHGHMDIEWYMPMRSYRFWTVEALDELLRISKEHPEFVTYVLDGQTCVLDIYLQARPSAKADMEELIKKGVLSIGPFFSQFDEWLISAESMVRNCLYGNRSCRTLGRHHESRVPARQFRASPAASPDPEQLRHRQPAVHAGHAGDPRRAP